MHGLRQWNWPGLTWPGLSIPTPCFFTRYLELIKSIFAQCQFYIYCMPLSHLYSTRQLDFLNAYPCLMLILCVLWIGDPWLAISRFWNFSDISIGDRDTTHFCAAPWPSFQKVTWPPEVIGHMTIRSATPDLLLVAFGIFQISLSVIKLLLAKRVVDQFCMGFSNQKGNLTATVHHR